MQYRFNMTYEEADFIGFMTAYIRRETKSGGALRLSRSISRLGGAFMVLVGAANIILSIYTQSKTGESYSVFYWLLRVIIIAAGLVIYYSRNDTTSGKVLWKKYDKKGSAVSVLFGPDSFKLHDRGGDIKHEYSEIKAVVEDELRYYVFFAHSDGYILRKDGISHKDAEGFGPFIEEKTGLKVIDAK